MPKIIIILDENCSFWLEKYLQDRHYSTLKISDGRSDPEVLELAEKNNAYVITKDRAFIDYRRAVLIGVRDTPGFVYRKLRDKMRL